MTRAKRKTPALRRAFRQFAWRSSGLGLRLHWTCLRIGTRATLAGTTSDPVLDQTIRDEVLNGLQLPQPPPSDMPMPIIMRIAESRTN